LLDTRLQKEFPEYIALISPKPLSITATQSLLRPDEVLIQFLDAVSIGKVPEVSFGWAITRTDARWFRVSFGTHVLAERVAALRCGLDRAAWDGESKSHCSGLFVGMDLNTAPKEDQPLPFDLTGAYGLYQALFGEIADLIREKHLLVVPSGSLTQLPFQVLVTEKPEAALNGPDAFKQAAWLAKSNPITVLPAVSSLAVLRERAKASRAKRPFIGFGNPLLDGHDARDEQRAELARARQQCAQVSLPRLPGRAGVIATPHQRGGLADLSEIHAQVPLPETADELCAVARTLGVPESEIWLGARANERDIKRLSDSGEFAAYRIVHFATHGAMAGEIKAEPGLILTPPNEASFEDDGYLSTSEIAALKLDADWVILSACNTAGGGAQGAEALSGVAKAFFYAGARALLVSHWAVNSDAAVKLITKSLSTMAADKAVGRSEALRRSMVALIEQGEPYEAHPAYWGPFVVVGEGAAGVAATPSSSPVTASAPTAKPALAAVPTPTRRATVEPSTQVATKKNPATTPRPKANALDWKKTIFDR
jgi:CHAT domain-containing protein